MFTSEKISKTSFLLRKLLYGHFLAVELRRNSLATAPSHLEKSP
jgi:hypothetical protein